MLHSDPSWLHTYANAKNICSAFHDYLPNTYMQYYLLGDEVMTAIRLATSAWLSGGNAEMINAAWLGDR